MSAAQKGRKVSEETRAKLAASQRARHERAWLEFLEENEHS
jgi:hypothetical protein